MGSAVVPDAWASPYSDVAFRLSPSPVLVLALTRKKDRLSLGLILDCSDSFVQLLGSARDEVVGRPLTEFVHPDDETLLQGGVDRFLDPGRSAQLRVIRPGWGVLWVALTATVLPDYPPDGLVVVALDDITAFRKAEQALAHRASHDPLTGLPNRAVLMSHLARVVARLGRRPGTVAVMFVDLDGFKNINDSFGHRLGDEVLKEVARRVSLAVRRYDVVTRMGGDEFVVVCDALETTSESASVAERIRAALDDPFEIHGRTHAMSGSVGVAQTSDPATTPEDLLRRADLAMYLAKERGRNRVEFFAADLEERVRGRVRMVEALRLALDDGRVLIHTQPVFSLTDSNVAGYEAFARLRTVDGSLLTPNDFLDAAEQSGLVVRLDNRVIDLSLQWLPGKRESGGEAGATGRPWVSVNVSSRLLASPRFGDVLRRRVEAHGLQPGDLVVEIGEASVVRAVGPAILTLRRLRTAGFRVALDNFGTGLSSLSALRELPVDFVKVDRSFVSGLGVSAADESIVAAVIRVAHDLGRCVVAQGVETPLQADFLREHACDLGQGYLLGSPVAVGGEP